MPSNSYDLVVLGDDIAAVVCATLCARRGLRTLLLGDDREMRHRGIRRDEFQRHQRRNGRSAVLVGEREPLRRR